MQLVSMDVNRNGSNDRLHLGPLSQGLNAICGPNGSGKTTLLHWLRESLVQENEHQPRTLVSRQPINLFGNIELKNQQHSTVVESTRDGRVHFGTSSCDRNGHGNGYMTPVDVACNVLTLDQQRAFGELTGIHHGINDIGQLESLARKLEIDRPQQSNWHTERQALQSRQNEINSRLRSLDGLRSTREGLLSRRGHLEAELHRAQRERGARDRERLEDHRSALASELRDVRAEIAALDRDIAGHKSGYSLRRSHHNLDIGATYREQLEQLDARLDRWRQTLRDLRSHRERLEHNATDARLDKQIGDQLSATKAPDPRSALRSLETQILSASRQIDSLVDRFDRSYESYTAQQSLPDTLRSMQRDLYEVCQQLARHESTAAAETLRQQAAQLARCESELLQSVEKLIEERAQLLRKIADEYNLSMDQLTLAFGDWCQCHDHPHLSQWLLNEAPGEYTCNLPEQTAREFFNEESRVWDARRVALQERAETLQVDLKEVESQIVARRHPESTRALRSESEVARDLDAVTSELRDLEERDRLRVELDEIRRALAKLPIETVAVDRFRQLVNKHIDLLMGSDSRWRQELSGRNRFGEFHLPISAYTAPSLYNGERVSYSNGSVEHRRVGKSAVPNSIVELAMRLAIVEVLAERGSPIILLADGALDHLGPELQQSAIRHLESVSSAGQQIVLLTSDERVADLVRSARGWVGYMRQWKTAPIPARTGIDVNRQLSAYANDWESDKWREPVVPRPIHTPRNVTRNNQFLTEGSLIEDCPSIDSTCAARCRALGIDRVGDLLAVDPHWLAEHLRINGVTSSTVMRWQAEARLLCSVRQLRPFDARVLAGAGVRHPRQLAEMHPSQLLDRVERFLATDRGREILRSGNSYELSRITSWIASAKSGDSRERTQTRDVFRDDLRDQSPVRYEPYRELPNNGTSLDSDPYEPDAYDRPTRDWRERNDDDRGDRKRTAREYDPRVDRSRRASRRLDRTEAEKTYPIVSREPASSRDSRDREPLVPRPETTVDRNPKVTNKDKSNSVRAVKGSNGAASHWRFHLDLSSPVVDAPSIGPKVASKLEEIGIRTIEQLLNVSAESIAHRLNARRVDATVVKSWQEQSKLVCRIPNLRGHDAQLLVAARLNSPEELARMNASSVLSAVQAVARSTEGHRILRGSQEPDLAEVNDWIHWASNSRALNAA
jgi:predicted flap endonuclease-1-like 5' DNA nuclease/energy-coupling factor transporter ATP-binding protein EcfA2